MARNVSVDPDHAGGASGAISIPDAGYDVIKSNGEETLESELQFAIMAATAAARYLPPSRRPLLLYITVPLLLCITVLVWPSGGTRGEGA